MAPPIYMRGGGKNQYIHQVLNFKPPLVFRVVLELGEGRGTQEGRRSSTLFSILYLYKSERVVQEKCRCVGTLLPACTLRMLLHSSGLVSIRGSYL
jgi:hypothetical protein